MGTKKRAVAQSYLDDPGMEVSIVDSVSVAMMERKRIKKLAGSPRELAKKLLEIERRLNSLRFTVTPAEDDDEGGYY